MIPDCGSGDSRDRRAEFLVTNNVRECDLWTIREIHFYA